MGSMESQSNEVVNDAAFPDYVVRTNETGAAFFAFVLVYTALAFCLIVPIATWKRLESESLKSKTDPEGEKDNGEGNEGVPTTSISRQVSHGTRSSNKTRTSKRSNNVNGRFGMMLPESESLTDCDTTSRLSSSIRQGPASVVSKSTAISKANTARLSAVPSAATTSRIYLRSSTTPTGKELPNRIWDSGRRRKHSRRSGLVDLRQSSWEKESNYMLNDGRSVASKMNRHSTRSSNTKGLSEVATSVLGEQGNDGNPMVFSRSALMRQQRLGPSKRSSFSSANGRSVLSSIVDDITPNDAADADDPGLGNLFQGTITPSIRSKGHGVDRYISNPSVSSALEGMLQLAELDDEMKRVLRLSVTFSAVALAEPLFRTMIVVTISNFVDSESMVAFLLVGLFLRLTSHELAGAIIDALSSFVQACLYSGEGDGAFLAGQLVQLAVIMQMILGIPLLVIWTLFMEDIVFWLVQSSTIANYAGEYTKVIVFEYLAQAISRTCTVLFHLCGHEHFESTIDISAGALNVVVVALVTGLVKGSDLRTVGLIQLLIGVGASLVKVAYPVVQGWMKPFWNGMARNFALVQNQPAFWNLARATLPLFVGTILEYGEWELLTIFLRHLGVAEVAAWALLGCLWELLEASTEGIGEAASIRVAYFLAVAKPLLAKKLSYKLICLSVIESLLLTSVLFICGKYVAILLTNDPTLQHLINNVLAMIGLANVTMAFAQIMWSLTGAQGRYREAMITMFVSRWLVTMPIALISIFGFKLDLNAVSGSLVVGYSTAACALSYFVIRSDWEGLSQKMQEEQDEFDSSEEFDDEFDEDDSSDEDDDTFDDF